MNVEYWNQRNQYDEVNSLEVAITKKLDENQTRYDRSPNEYIAGLAARLVEKGLLTLDEVTDALDIGHMREVK